MLYVEKNSLKSLKNNFGGLSLKKHILRTLLCLMLFANFLPKIFATDISDDFGIDFIDKNSVTITRSHNIEIDGKKYRLGEKNVCSFLNTEEGRSNLSENVPSNLFSSILNFWDSTGLTVQSTKQFAKLSKEANQAEVAVKEYKNLGSLSSDKVSFFIIKKVQMDGMYYTLGEPKEVFYENSSSGRRILQSEVQEPFYSLVMSVWGNTPTVISDESDEQPQTELQSEQRT